MQLLAPSANVATYRALIEEQLQGADQLLGRLEEPNLRAVRDSVALFQTCLASLVGGESSPGSWNAVRHRTLQRSFTAWSAFRTHGVAAAALLLLDAWFEETRDALELSVHGVPRADLDEAESAMEQWLLLGSEVAELRSATVRSLPGRLAEIWALALDPVADAGSQLDDEWLLLYNQAVGEALAREMESGRARAALRALMTQLQLGQDDLGRLFGVSGESIRRWERGAVEIPNQRQAAILATETSLRRLLEIFRPERLPVVVRREAEIFDGETALEWILRGRIADVVERYETAFLYQG